MAMQTNIDSYLELGKSKDISSSEKLKDTSNSSMDDDELMEMEYDDDETIKPIYRFDSDIGKLTISGTGEINGKDAWNAVCCNPPKEPLKEVEIGAGITSIGSGSFYERNDLTKVTISKDVKIIGKKAFADCYSL